MSKLFAAIIRYVELDQLVAPKEPAKNDSCYYPPNFRNMVYWQLVGSYYLRFGRACCPHLLI